MAESQVVMLTGAASGIGRYLAGELVARGDRLLACDIAAEPLAQLTARWPADRVLPQVLDVRDPGAWRAAIDRVVERWGRLDVLLNVAGIIQPGLVHETAPPDIDWHIDVNAKGVMYGTQAAAAVMVRQGAGHIVNIASMAALAPIPGIAFYCASKWAVRGFTLAVAQELRPRGVKVSVICPDAVQTPMLDKQLDFPEAAMTFSTSHPLTAEDVGRAVLDRALRRGQLEIVLPASRGYLAKLSSMFPSLIGLVQPGILKQGQKRQAEARARHTAQRS
ncbi:MAG: SDR family oxidoreductase [Pirellulales bacterium]|nr:SDR family oxidoreductase [Pirellulales bacterium]